MDFDTRVLSEMGLNTLPRVSPEIARSLMIDQMWPNLQPIIHETGWVLFYENENLYYLLNSYLKTLDEKNKDSPITCSVYIYHCLQEQASQEYTDTTSDGVPVVSLATYEKLCEQHQLGKLEEKMKETRHIMESDEQLWTVFTQVGIIPHPFFRLWPIEAAIYTYRILREQYKYTTMLKQANLN